MWYSFKMKRFNELRNVAKAYLRARKKFRRLTDQIPELNGNDNLVGRIGEFIAFQFLKLKLKRKNVVRNTNTVQAGYDIIADKKRVSVKIITAENRTGSTTPIRDPWDELVLIELGEASVVSRIGHLDRKGFERALKEKFLKNRHPIAKRSMLGPARLIGTYGIVYDASKLSDYL